MFNQQAYYENIARQMRKAQELKGNVPECEFCGSDVLTHERAEEIFREAGRWPHYCTGIQYMQLDPYTNELYGDEELYLMCDGQAHQAAMDI